MLIQKDICTRMFTAALLTIVKIWKQPKCPSIDEWVKKMWYMEKMDYYSAVKNEILPFAIWMDLDGIMPSEICQMEKDKYHIISHVESKKQKNK